MADNEQKNYFSFLDIPDGNGGTERWHAKDAEAQAAIQIIEEEIQQLDPASVIEVSDITALTTAQCEGLVVGGSVNKSDATGKHSYKVTFKGTTGLCLTYADAVSVEVVSYTKSNGAWAYSSTVSTPTSNPVMTGATSSVAGEKGLVPKPSAGDNDKFLKGDGTWSDDLPRASFVGTTLVFSSGGVFSGSTLLLG